MAAADGGALLPRRLRAPTLVLFLACLGLAGCGFEPFQPPVSGDAPGPGLFSGPSGEFVITRPTAEPAPMKPQTPAPQTGQGVGEPD